MEKTADFLRNYIANVVDYSLVIKRSYTSRIFSEASASNEWTITPNGAGGGSGNTLQRSLGSFVLEGFTVGQQILVYSSGDLGTVSVSEALYLGTIETVDALQITFEFTEAVTLPAVQNLTSTSAFLYSHPDLFEQSTAPLLDQTTAIFPSIKTYVETKDFLHAKEGLKANVNASEKEVLAVYVDTQTLVFDGYLYPVETCVIQPPYYFHGTARQVNLERTNNVAEDELYPFVWLYEILRETTIRDELNPLGKIVPIRLFFLDCYDDSDDFDTEEHYSQIISRMDNLAKRVEQSFYENEDLIGKYDRFTIVPHVKFGVFSSYKGHEKAIFDEKLSGVELQLDLPLLKQCSLTC